MSAPALSPELAAKRDALLDFFRPWQGCVVAYSGGVDSAVVAQAAALVLRERALAVTGASPSLPQGELQAAAELARRMGIRHRVVHTQEFANPNYVQNAPDRCYHCKTELYTRLAAIAREVGAEVIVNGANLDDQRDYRPGMQAAAEHGVRSPLVEAGLVKADVRLLAAHWELPVAEKPAAPCLSSRVAYGEAVTPERLRIIEQAEQWLRRLGLAELRVRYHPGDLARIEVPLSAIAQLVQPGLREALVQHFRELGFRYVTLDLAGFRSGSLNVLVAPEQLLSPRRPHS
ncbi:MAG: ATP-dependent sacrificial sulfur transferase LarE [Pirellulales bacterium]|nr:ATP-dependent sacrificial sulfur transferase LarE [Pirellulales bacterium]